MELNPVRNAALTTGPEDSAVRTSRAMSYSKLLMKGRRRPPKPAVSSQTTKMFRYFAHFVNV